MELFQQNVKAALDRLSAIRIVPVLVLDNLDDGLRMCSILQEKQLSAAEITFRTEAAERDLGRRELFLLKDGAHFEAVFEIVEDQDRDDPDRAQTVKNDFDVLLITPI